MERFNFGLQRVLDFKINIEEKKKEEFVKALKNSIAQEKKLKYLLDEKSSSSKQILKFKTSLEYQNFSRYMEYIDNKIENQRYKLQEANEKLEDCKKELIKSTADRKILDKLKEKALEEFEREEAKKEQKLNDDFALFSYMKFERR